MYTVYHYVDGGPDYTAEMQRIVDEFNNETGTNLVSRKEIKHVLPFRGRHATD